MKSRKDFETEEDYHEYLTHYYTGKCLEGYLSSYAGLTAQPPPAMIANNSVRIAEFTIRVLKGEQILESEIKKK